MLGCGTLCTCNSRLEGTFRRPCLSLPSQAVVALHGNIIQRIVTFYSRIEGVHVIYYEYIRLQQKQEVRLPGGNLVQRNVCWGRIEGSISSTTPGSNRNNKHGFQGPT